MRFNLLICLFLLQSLVQAQYRFNHLGIKDGLSQSSVNDILQDSEGFMWFATQDGLNRYDGNEFTYFTTESSPSVAGNFLWSLVEDPAGNIWSASQSGATRLNWKDGSSTKFYFDRQNKIQSHYNQVSSIQIHGNQVFVSFDGKGTYQIPHDAYLDSVEVQFGADHIKYASSDTIRRYLYTELEIDGRKVSVHLKNIMVDEQYFEYPPGYTVNSFKGKVFTYGNGFFLGTNNGLLFFDLQTETFVKSCVEQGVNDIEFDPEAKLLWVGTDEGLYFFEPEKMVCTKRLLSGQGENELTSSLVASIYRSHDGLFWIGTANGGLNIYTPEIDQFKYLKKDHGLSGKPIWSVLSLPKRLIMGSDDGIYLINYDDELTKNTFASEAITQVTTPRTDFFEDKRITALHSSESEQILFGTMSGELGYLNLITNKIMSVSLFSNPVISSISVRNDTIWAATYNGIYQLDSNLALIDHLTYHDNPERFPSNYYLSSHQTKDESLWFGSNVGFTIHHPEGSVKNVYYDEHNPQKSPNHYFITGFFEDAQGFIWMSTFGGGVSRYDRESDQFLHFTSKDGLSNNTCASIQGNEEKVYVGTNSGLSIIDLQTHQIQNFTVEDGLQNNEFAMASSSKMGDELFFGVVDGLVAFNTTRLKDVDPKPPKISSLEINYNKKPYSRITNGELNLYPADKIFSLSFANLTFKNNEQITFECRLDGFNQEWIKIKDGDRAVTYSLSPGNYTFEVRSILNGQTSESSTLAIFQRPAFYQTWWFIVASIAFGITLVVGASRYFSHQALKEQLRKLEVQQKIQKERERISRDLHDNVGSQITYIATSIDNLSGSGDINEIKELGDFTRDTMRQLRETIWVINRDHVTFNELRAKVIDYLSDVLKHSPNIAHEVRISEHEVELNPEYAINLFRIIQEAVNNAIKHASPTRIRIELESMDHAVLTIEDDGIGFDGKDKIGHFGLLNLRSRAADLGGDFSLQSEKGKGTIIKISNLKIGQMS